MSNWVKQRILAIRAEQEAERTGEEMARLYVETYGAPEKIRTGAAVLSDELDYDWFPIDEGPVRFWVFRDAAKIKGVRINVSAAEAQTWADELGALLTTPKIEDLIYKHATVKIPPFTGNPATTTAAQHSAKIDAAIPAINKDLVATVGKSWVLTNKLSSTVAANYGWHTQTQASEPSATLPGVNVWQGTGHKHNPQHRDYSQTLRLVSRKVVIDGKVWDLEKALRDPAVAHYFSHVGPLQITRQPGTTALAKDVLELSQNPTDYPSIHHYARALIVQGFKDIFSREPNLTEAQFAQAVALYESSYGRGWKDAGIGSNNWGAIQASRPPCNPATSFPYGDSSPTPTGQRKYSACFKKYPTPLDGARDVIRVMYKQRPSVLEAAKRGDLRGVSTAMRQTTYYEGWGPTREIQIDGHVKAMTGALGKITRALGEPMPSSSSKSSGGGVVGFLIIGGLTALAIARA